MAVIKSCSSENLVRFFDGVEKKAQKMKERGNKRVRQTTEGKLRTRCLIRRLNILTDFILYKCSYLRTAYFPGP